MSSLFDRPRHSGGAVRKIKDHIYEQFKFPESTLITVAELRCHEPGCPPVETVISAYHANLPNQDWRISKPIAEITLSDITGLVWP